MDIYNKNIPKGIKGFQKGNKARKKAPHTLEAAKAREFIIRKVCEHLEPIINKLLELAKKGDKEAIKILLDRGFGKVKESIELSGDPENPIRVVKIKEDGDDH